MGMYHMVSQLNVSTELNCALLAKLQHFHYFVVVDVAAKSI